MSLLESIAASDAKDSQLPLWMKRLREDSERVFAETGLPRQSDEEWRYSQLAETLGKRHFHEGSAGESPEPDAQLVEEHRLRNAYCLTFVDGRFSPAASASVPVDEGIIILAMKDALLKCPELVEKSFNSVADRHKHGFLTFTTAYGHDGVFVYLPEGRFLSSPLQILNLTTRDEGVSALRHLIVLGSGAQLQVLETYAGISSNSGLTSVVTEMVLGSNSLLQHYKLQAESKKNCHFGGLYASQEKFSRFQQVNLALGGGFARTEVHTELADDAECELEGLFVTDDRQQIDNHALVHHNGPRTRSRVIYRGIAGGRSRGVFSGRVRVDRHAQKTDAVMSNQNLLLSERAEIDSKPQLEIHADDVRCSHGVTVGQLDPEAVFFMQSRGMEEPEARMILTFAFANELLEKIDLQGLKEQAGVLLEAALPQFVIQGEKG